MTAPGDALASPADALRAWGTSHPTFAFLHGLLAPYGGADRPHAPGLYLDAVRAPWVSVKGELRISLGRIYSVHADGHVLVGQVHATERAGPDGRVHRRLRAYLHRPDEYLTEEVHSLDAWWLAVLERHYELGGAPLDMRDAAPAPA